MIKKTNRLVAVVSVSSITSFAALALCGSVACAGGGSSGKVTKLTKMALQIDIGGGKVNEAPSGRMAMIDSKSLPQVKIEKWSDALDAETYKASEVESKHAKNVQVEKLADGWAITDEWADDAGATHFSAIVSRTLGDSTYQCRTTAPTAQAATAVATACKTLRK